MERNIAVVGCGYWGKNLVRNFAKLDSLHTVCDMDSRMLEEYKFSYPQVATETDYSQVVGNDEITGVVIATPAALHYPMAKEALTKGKDVFVEKPFTTSSKHAQELLELSTERHRILMVGHLLLYHPAVRMLKEYVQSGELGEIYYLYSTRVNLGQIREEESALWRLLPHDIAMFIYLIDESPIVLSAQGASYLQPNLVDVAFVVLRFGNVLAHIHASWFDPHRIRQLTIVGSKKMAVFDDANSEHKLHIYDKRIAQDTLLIKSGEVYNPKVDSTEPLFLECQEFVRCINERKQPLSDAKQGLQVVEVLEAAQGSLQKAQNLNSGDLH